MWFKNLISFSRLLTASFASKRSKRRQLVELCVLQSLDLLFLTRSTSPKNLWPLNPLAKALSDICLPLTLLIMESPINKP